MTRTATRGCAAIARQSMMAVGVSIMAQIKISLGAPAASSAADTSFTSATELIFGMTTADTHALAAAATSA